MPRRFELKPYVLSTLMVAAALGIGLALRQTLAVTSISLVFLTAVLSSAALYGLWPSLYACLASVLAYNFFFLPPVYSFTIADPENAVALFFFALAAVIASNLAAGVRAQALTASTRARTTEELYQFSRKLAGIVSLDDLLWATAYQIASMLGVRVVLLLPEGGSVAVRAGYPPEDELDAADIAAAKWCWQSNREAGRGADTLPGGGGVFAVAHRQRSGRCGRHRQRPAGGRHQPDFHAGSAPAARRVDRPGGGFDRAHQPGGRRGTGRGCWRRRSGCARRC